MSLRAATAADAGAVAALWNAMIRDTLATFTTEEKTPAGIAALIAERPGAFVLAEAAGAVRGFASYGAFRPGPGYAATGEHTVVVAPGAARQGVGTALMDRLERQAAAAGLRQMVAGISSANPGAVAFHAARGFVQVGLLPEVGFKAGRRLDLILMQKSLARR